MDRPGDVSALISRVRDGPAGPAVGAFFDFDGTLISGYSAAKFYRERLRRRDVTVAELGELALAILSLTLRGDEAEGPLRTAIGQWSGRSVRELEALSERIFRERIAPAIHPGARALLDAHRRRGHTVVVATSATRFQAGPAARDLGVEHLLCTEVGARDGVLTGQVDGPIPWGAAKAEAVQRFAAAHGIVLRDSHAYGNGDEDVAFLGTVGHPCAINPGPRLAARARDLGWPVLAFDDPASAVRLVPVLRTAAAVVGLGAAVGLAAGVGLLRRDRRTAANLAISLGCDVVLELTGIRVNVEGVEHLRRRPAVFVFNHQSGIDPFVVGSILRRDVTAIAKKQLARDPRVAPAGWLVDVVYVDRGDPSRAREAVAPAVERLRQGISLAVAPEGTRSPTPRLGPFKKGAFHLAQQAGVPIVPIVIRNTGEVMWARSNVARAGTVDVRVLPPVETRGWSPATMDAHAAEVRRLFVEALDGWDPFPVPAPTAAAAASAGRQ
jgi:putative phosphoserine phosphatase/1-acylglycerol-3-phosphate O-acyltransferase